MDSFFEVKKPEEVYRIIEGFESVEEEHVSIEKAIDRVLSRKILSPEDLPNFFRSTMDGYAVKAKDTFGASESLPALFEVDGEVLMGQVPKGTVETGKAVKISTGGMLPDGSDGVVMVEYCHLLDETTLEVNRAISPLENVIQPGDDLGKGESVLDKGHRLRPQDLGVFAGLGISEIAVYKKPRVFIISTGDEVVDINSGLAPGLVRDINRYTLGSFCQKIGAEPFIGGICKDDFDSLKDIVGKGLNDADSVWISGGSSVGTRDLTLQVLESFSDFELLVHGISISPGKPTIIGRVGSIPVIGLPGHVASALVVAEIFMTRLITQLSGLGDKSNSFHSREEATLGRNIESAPGREDYVRVKLISEGNKLVAEPIFGKSALISTLVEADGLLRIDMNTEGLYQGEVVGIMLFNPIQGGGS